MQDESKLILEGYMSCNYEDFEISIGDIMLQSAIEKLLYKLTGDIYTPLKVRITVEVLEDK